MSTVIEFLDRILPGMDGEVSKQMQRILSKSRASFSNLSTKVTSVEKATGWRQGNSRLWQPDCGWRAHETLEADAVRAGRDRPSRLRPPISAYRGGGRQAGRAWARDHRRWVSAPTCAQHLCHRRRGARRPDAGAQGGGRGRGLGRDPRRPARPRELRGDPRRRLHLAGGRRRRPHRGGAEGGQRRLQGRQVSVHRERPGAGRCVIPTAS